MDTHKRDPQFIATAIYLVLVLCLIFLPGLFLMFEIARESILLLLFRISPHNSKSARRDHSLCPLCPNTAQHKQERLQHSTTLPNINKRSCNNLEINLEPSSPALPVPLLFCPGPCCRVSGRCIADSQLQV